MPIGRKKSILPLHYANVRSHFILEGKTNKQSLLYSRRTSPTLVLLASRNVFVPLKRDVYLCYLPLSSFYRLAHSPLVFSFKATLHVLGKPSVCFHVLCSER